MDRPEAHLFQGIELSSILYSQSVTGRRTMNHRRYHALIIKMQGTTEYYSQDSTLQLSAGEVLSLTKGCSYSFREITPGYAYIVNFDCPGSFAEPLTKLPLPSGFDIKTHAEKLYRSWQKENVYGSLALLYSLLEKTTAAAGRELYVSPQEKQRLAPVMAYLKEHLTDPELKLEALPRLAGVSDTYLRRIFKKQYGMAPASFVLSERMRLAKQLLTGGEEPLVAQVALQVGYNDPLYFSRLFKKQTGCSPTEYRQIHMEDLF